MPYLIEQKKIGEEDPEKDLGEDPERDPRWIPISIPGIITRLFGQYVSYVGPPFDN
jgi:hypothetical protein